MKQLSKLERIFAILAIAFGIAGIACCAASLGLSVTNSEYSKFTLAFAIFFVGLIRICLHISKHKGSMIYNLATTGLIFVLAILVLFSQFSIYFLTVSFFIFSVLICVNRVFMIKNNHSVQSIVLNSLVIAFCFTYSFIFLFPSIYEKHATSVSNWNFVVLSYTIIVLFTCAQNALLPLKKRWKLDSLIKIISKTLTMEILMGLMFLITLFSVYFTLVEPGMVSFVDSLWYCFSVITTIGFGDVSVTTTFGRILSVILGIYGIVVVGLVTSIIVNFYNELSRKREDNILKRIEKKEEEMEQIVADNKEQKEETSSEE